MQQQLTQAASSAVESLAQRYGVSVDAVTTLLSAVAAGGGSMAQFYHPELGGGGQWMRGGMTMVGDMFNSRLQSTVSGLCAELSSLLGSLQVWEAPLQSAGLSAFASGNAWWPAELGQPSSSGGQNDARYAYFPSARRLAILRGGQLFVYDTLDHQIGGVQQQGGAHGSLSFSSQFGTFGVESLPLVSPAPQASTPASAGVGAPWSPAPAESGAPWSPAPPQPGAPSASQGDVLGALERLGQLRDKGVLTEDEFSAKKAELLARL